MSRPSLSRRPTTRSPCGTRSAASRRSTGSPSRVRTRLTQCHRIRNGSGQWRPVRCRAWLRSAMPRRQRLAADRVMVDVVPDGVGAPALADAIARVAGVMSRRPRAVAARGPRADDARASVLASAGAVVTAPIAYRTLAPVDGSLAALSDALASNRVAAIAFCSPSSAREPGSRLGTHRPLDPAGPPAGRVDRADDERGAPRPLVWRPTCKPMSRQW